MQFAVSYGLMFRCDPMAFLDRPVRDYPVLIALLHEANSRHEKARKEAERGQR